ncbi:hypothetical protein ACIGMX_42015 [Streptomyces aquilus]|uniref:hypothetical protein n=1 Tax=Streptomyces aquilus TaxID=2548456 RepID=UPI0037D04AD9
MTLRSRLVLPLLCAAAALLSSGCDSGTAAAEADPAAAGAPAALRLKPVSPVPHALAHLAPDGTLGMPSGWNIDSTGVVRSGRNLAFLAVPPAKSASDGQGSETWVVDSGTGTVRRYQQANPGWTSNTVTLASGRLLRVESRQLDGTACGEEKSEAADCYRWRLYSQPLSSHKPVLLARSAHAGPQSLVPHPLAYKGSFVWEEALPGGKTGVFRWTPGKGRPVRVLTRAGSGFGQLDVDGRTLYLTEGKLSQDGGTSIRTTYRLGLGQHPTAAVKVATFTGSGGFAVRGGRIAYYPRSADETARIKVLTIGAETAPIEVGKAVNGFYTVAWVTKDRLVTWSGSGYALNDVRRPTKATVFAADAVGLGVPRGYDDTLYVVYDPYQFAQSRGTKPTVLAWRHSSS